MKNFKSKIFTALTTISVGLSIFAAAAVGSLSAYGITYDAKEPVKWGICQTIAPASFTGTPTQNLTGQVQLMRYTGSGWVGQGGIINYTLYKSVAYGGSVNPIVNLTGGAYTYRVRTRLVNSVGTATAWDNSAGKNLLCT